MQPSKEQSRRNETTFHFYDLINFKSFPSTLTEFGFRHFPLFLKEEGRENDHFTSQKIMFLGSTDLWEQDSCQFLGSLTTINQKNLHGIGSRGKKLADSDYIIAEFMYMTCYRRIYVILIQNKKNVKKSFSLTLQRNN